MTEPRYESDLSEAQMAALEAYRERLAICEAQDDVTPEQALELAIQSGQRAFDEYGKPHHMTTFKAAT